jgi:hypothetical protein
MSLNVRRTRRAAVTALLLAVFAASTASQTKVNAPKNKFTVAQDVQLGREAAAEVERQMPLLRDSRTSSYVDDLGDRLVDAIPAEFRHREFRYSFKTVDLKEINAFALPGGPMYLHRGMIEAARTEGEIAGVMAHEMAHVALRHGTAQASKAQKYQIGAIAGQILGSIIGGRTGTVVAEGSRFGLGVSFLRFSRAYEKDADILGAQMMARAGYDPVEMANMFRTIEQQSRGGGPEFLSNHPNPGNRIQYITAEARSLRIENRRQNSGELQEIHARLRSMPAARSSAEVARNQSRDSGPVGTAGIGRVEPPSPRYRTYSEGGLHVAVPENWEPVSGGGGNAVWFAPQGAYGRANGREVFTHGMQFGAAQTSYRDVNSATSALVQSLAQGNPNLRRQGNARRTTFAERDGLVVQLRNASDVTGRGEVVTLHTALIENGTLVYAVGVAPEEEARQYVNVFGRVASSVRVR